jgi:hypothetical protein
LTAGLAAAGGIAGAMIGGCAAPGAGIGGTPAGSNAGGTLPLVRSRNTTSSVFPAGIGHEIASIIQAEGTASNGVFSIEIDRDDISNVTLNGVPILPSFEINGDLYFQSMGGRQVFMNSDIPLKASEIDPFIDRLMAHNIVFQAEHQHFYDFNPMVWFIHFRMMGDAGAVARAVKAALNVTSTPFPQTAPPNPKTPLPAKELGNILGAVPSIGANGVVNFNVPRANPMTLGGVQVNPYLNIATSISFEPYGGGHNCAAVPDFGMVASEVQPVVRHMRRHGWDIGCLYNQETDEQPQLYFSHQFKTGNALELAREIRSALSLMEVQYCSPPSA